jgi:hypothetical protein
MYPIGSWELKNPSAHAAMKASTITVTTITTGNRDRRGRSKIGP